MPSTDQDGSVRTVLNNAGVAIQSIDYDAFGNPWFSGGAALVPPWEAGIIMSGSAMTATHWPADPAEAFELPVDTTDADWRRSSASVPGFRPWTWQVLGGAARAKSAWSSARPLVTLPAVLACSLCCRRL